IDEALTGMCAEETKTFTTQLAGGEHAGEDAEVEVKVNVVKERELPDLDDDFAQLASEHDTLAELRDATREQLQTQAEATQAQQVKENSLDALVQAVDIPVPEGFVVEEVKQRLELLKQQLSNMGLDLRTYLAAQGQELEEFEADQKETAETGLRRQLVLEKVAEDREIEVTTEQLTEEVRLRAAQQGAEPQEYAVQLQQQGRLPALAGEIRRALALDEVVRAAAIVDGDGKELGNDVLFPEAASGDAEKAD
ncbi:MAG: trigger factor, partial [Stackebrandtia sp.]